MSLDYNERVLEHIFELLDMKDPFSISNNNYTY